MKLLINLIICYTSLLPQCLAVWSGCLLGWFLGRVLKFKRRLMLKQIREAMTELTDEEVEKLLARVYRHLGLLLVEILRLPNFFRLNTHKRVSVEGVEEHLLPEIEKGKGVLMLTGHIGNWELAGASLNVLGFQLHPVVKEMKSEAGMYLLKRMRADNGIVTLPRKNSVRDIIRTLKEGRIITFVLDQNMTSSEGAFVDFFGRPACTMTGLATLSKKTGAPVAPIVFVRNPDLKSFTFKVLPALKWEEVGETAKDVILHNTQIYTTVLENMIRETPEQWIWMHKRWKTQPVEEPPAS